MPTTSNFGWTTPADTDLVKDGAAAIRTLGNGVDSSFVDLKGGTSGQILAKNSNTDLDFVWVANDQGDITAVTAGTGISGGGTSGAVTITNSMATEITAKGDLIVGTGNGTFDNLAAGTNGFTLVADSSVSPQGLKWAVDPVADVITTAGDLIYGTAADTVARLGIGTAGQVLKVNSGATAPEWGAAASTAFVGCSVYKSGTQSLANNTVVVVTWDSEYYDTDAIHSTASNTSRFTVPAGLGGKWELICSLSFAAATAGTYRALRLRKNGADINFFDGAPAGSTSQTSISYSNILELVATDYIEVTADQDSGGTINLSGGTGRSFLTFTKVG